MFRRKFNNWYVSALWCVALPVAIGGCPADDAANKSDPATDKAEPTETPVPPAKTTAADVDATADDKPAPNQSGPHDVPSTPPAEEFPHGGMSNAGTYRIAYRTNPEPLPLNQMFRVAFQLFNAKADNVPITDAEVLVDAAMPAHGHGMNTTPEVTLGDDGVYEAAGMLFHMSGHWELYFDVTRNGITERAQFDVNLE